MTARPEVQKIGIQLICRYNTIHMRSAAVLQKIAILQEFIKKRCADAPTAAIVSGKKSGTQSVFEIIQSSEKGADPLFIREMTGFKEQKIAKILYKLFKYGEIRIESGGLYVAVAASRISGIA
jgi:hypothetical protein